MYKVGTMFILTIQKRTFLLKFNRCATLLRCVFDIKTNANIYNKKNVINYMLN